MNLELPEGDRFADDKADILDINGFSESQEFTLRIDAEPSEDLLAFLRIINLSGGIFLPFPLCMGIFHFLSTELCIITSCLCLAPEQASELVSHVFLECYLCIYIDI